MALGHEPLTAPQGEPLISSSFVAAIRRLLIEDGHWDATRAGIVARDVHASEWIDAPLRGEWYPLERHLALMQALEEVVGEEGMRALGQLRLQETLRGGVLSPIFRSWARSYSAAPVQFLRVAPHAWNAGTRNLGRLEVVRVGERELHLRLVDACDAIRASLPWQRFLEGYAHGLLEAGGLEGTVAVVTTIDALDVAFRWQ